MRSKCAPDKMSAGWNIEVVTAGVISTPYRIGEGGAKIRTTLGYRGRGGAMRTYGVEGCTLCVTSAKFLLGLERLPLDLALVMFSAWRVRSPPERPLDFFCYPGVAC